MVPTYRGFSRRSGAGRRRRLLSLLRCRRALLVFTGYLRLKLLHTLGFGLANCFPSLAIGLQSSLSMKFTQGSSEFR